MILRYSSRWTSSMTTGRTSKSTLGNLKFSDEPMKIKYESGFVKGGISEVYFSQSTTPSSQLKSHSNPF